jgi:hypothetical protein
MRASGTYELVFDGVRVPIENRLGAEGEGTRAMMRNLEIERLTLAAMSVGIAKRCLRVMIDYANERKSFGVPLREHGQIQRYIAETFAEYRAAKSLVYDTARRLDLARTGSGSTPTPRSCSRARSASARPTRRSRCSAATATWASTSWRGCGATRSCSRSAAARSRRTTRTSPRISRGIRRSCGDRMETLRTETAEGVREIVLCRADAYNTITPALRDELAAAIDAADADRDVRVILLRAEGPRSARAMRSTGGRPRKRGETRSRARLGLRRRHAHDRQLRRHLHEALVRAASRRSPRCRAGASAAAPTWCCART